MLKTKAYRPDYCTEEHLEYLDELRESGVTNMYGARPWIEKEFPELTADRASKILLYWMHSFSDRHPRQARDK